MSCIYVALLPRVIYCLPLIHPFTLRQMLQAAGLVSSSRTLWQVQKTQIAIPVDVVDIPPYQLVFTVHTSRVKGMMSRQLSNHVREFQMQLLDLLLSFLFVCSSRNFPIAVLYRTLKGSWQRITAVCFSSHDEALIFDFKPWPFSN